MGKKPKIIGMQQILRSPDTKTKSILKYLCEQSRKLSNIGVYFGCQTVFQTGKILTEKIDLTDEQPTSKSMLLSLIPSVFTQRILISATQAFNFLHKLKAKFIHGQLDFKPGLSDYLTSAKLSKVADHNTGVGRATLANRNMRFS